METLLERQTELAELAGLARRAARGAGRVVLLRGEAGVGKTAVIARFVAELDTSWRVLRGWCDPLAAPRPLGPLLDTVTELSGEPAAAIRAAINAGDSHAMYRGLQRLFSAAGRWVWVIEDLHWADGATLDLLRFVSRRIDSLPLLLVVSYRDDELGEQHPLSVALGDIATCPALCRIRLTPLSVGAVTQLTVGTGVNAEGLYQLTGGNPFYVSEVLAAGPDALDRNALPRSVSEAVWGRLARLSTAGRAAAHGAAVCGPRASPALVEVVCPGAGAGLAECLQAGVLVADGDVVGFRHELARRATVEQIPDYQRRSLHKRVLAELAEPPIDPNTLAALVFHAEQAGDGAAVLRYGPDAAERAAALGANREAAELYRLVLRHADAVAVDQKVRWVEQHAFTSYLGGLVQASVHSYRDAITLRRQLGDRLGEGDNLRRLSHLLSRASEARKAGRASLQLLEDLGSTPQLAWSLLHMAELSFLGYDPACAAYAARAITLGNELDLPAIVIKARFFAALSTVVRSDVGWDTAEAAWREAMDAAALTEHAGLMGMGLCWQAALHHDLDRAEGYLAETTAFCTDHGLGTFKFLVMSAAALVGLHRGQWTRADACAEDVLSRPAMSNLHTTLPLITLALTRARRGHQPVAQLLDQALATAEHDDFCRLGPVWAARAEAAWLTGDDETARAEAAAGLATCATVGGDPWLVGALQRWARLAGESSHDAANGGAVTPFELEVNGDWRAAAQEWTRRGCPYDAAIAQLGGDIGAVQAALDTFRELGARAAARRARQLLHQLRGHTPHGRRADTMSDPDGLTRREREVLELLADGRSDTQIATALHISPKTAGTHVSSILTKLDVDNRIQAATRALQQQAVTKRS